MSIDLPDSIIISSINEELDQLISLLSGVDFRVLPQLQYTLDALGSGFDQKFYGIQDDIAGLITDIETSNDTVGNSIISEFDSFLVEQDQWWLSTMDTINDTVSNVTDNVSDELRSLYESITNELNTKVDLISDAMGVGLASFPNLLWSSLNDVIDPLKLASEIGNMLSKGVSKYLEFSEESVVDVMKMFVNIQSKMGDYLVESSIEKV